MLTKKEIQNLASKSWLTLDEQRALVLTLLAYIEINENQADLLRQCLARIDSQQVRLDFYRSATMTLV